jgi:large subunit ribosomal protein L13
MKTYIPKVDDVHAGRKWYLIDLKGKALGRAAVEVANILRGKDKPYFTPHMDTGDYIVAINARHLTVSGNKAEYMKYYRYSGYPGGMHVKTFEKMIKERPEFVFEHAVKGMIPKNRLGRKLFKKLHVYADAEHLHKAQQPEELKILESK